MVEQLMATQHTPGPWGTDLLEHDHPYQDIVVRAGTRTICRVWIDDAPVHDYNAAQLANARLIAAAPELLEALKVVIDDLMYKDHARVINVAHAAIAKATGAAQ